MIPIEPMNGMDIVVLVAAFIFFIIVYRYLSNVLRTLMILAISLVVCVSIVDITSRTLAKYAPEDNMIDIPFFQTFMGEGQTEYQRSNENGGGK